MTREHRPNPSGTDHVPQREAPGEEKREQRELTEYREPPGKRDRPGARERERRPSVGGTSPRAAAGQSPSPAAPLSPTRPNL